MLYGKNVNVEEMDERFLSLSSNHKVLFGKDNPMIFSASGRTEIAGNHTDHNLGLVIGAAINLDTIAAVTKRDDMVINFCSEGFPKCTIDISDLEIKEEEKNTTASLLRGVAKAFKDRGFDIKGFDANVTSKVLIGMREVLKQVNPNIVLVHGDTTTTFAGALAAYYNQVDIGHVEAGLRTWNKYSPYPEEMNRQMVGVMADMHFAPTENSKKSLLKENKDESKIYVTGNIYI